MIDHVTATVGDFERGKNFYYSAYVYDFDGDNVEAVCRDRE